MSTPKASGTTLTTEDAISLAEKAGFQGKGLETIVAIAWAESGLRTAALGGPNSNGTYDYGILQINTVHMGQHWSGGTMDEEQAYDPQTAFQFGYWLSKNGTNFSPWSTYQSGKYTGYLSTVEQALPHASVQTNQKPWWEFGRIDNFGLIDPQGNYWKPDSNILTPYGYPVVIPPGGEGVISSVQRTTWGQTVVTVKLSIPFNDLATHIFFEHMHDATVEEGQTVSVGQLIGHANDAGEGANLGFGLYSGDVYGSGSAWNTLQGDLAPGGAGLLNPVALLNSWKAGTPVIDTTSFGLNGSAFSGQVTGGGSGFDQGQNSWDTLSIRVHNTLVQYPGAYGIAAALDEAEQWQGAYISNANPYPYGAYNPANDVYDATETIVGTIAGNALPFVIRASLIAVGMFILIAFIWQMMKPGVEALPDLIGG